MGDKARVELARVLGSGMRTQDVLCRWGGEEFMILAPNVDKSGALQMAE